MQELDKAIKRVDGELVELDKKLAAELGKEKSVGEKNDKDKNNNVSDSKKR